VRAEGFLYTAFIEYAFGIVERGMKEGEPSLGEMYYYM
jgi:hypothetical protein